MTNIHAFQKSNSLETVRRRMTTRAVGGPKEALSSEAITAKEVGHDSSIFET